MYRYRVLTTLPILTPSARRPSVIDWCSALGATFLLLLVSMDEHLQPPRHVQVHRRDAHDQPEVKGSATRDMTMVDDTTSFLDSPDLGLFPVIQQSFPSSVWTSFTSDTMFGTLLLIVLLLGASAAFWSYNTNWIIVCNVIAMIILVIHIGCCIIQNWRYKWLILDGITVLIVIITNILPLAGIGRRYPLTWTRVSVVLFNLIILSLRRKIAQRSVFHVPTRSSPFVHLLNLNIMEFEPVAWTHGIQTLHHDQTFWILFDSIVGNDPATIHSSTAEALNTATVTELEEIAGALQLPPKLFRQRFYRTLLPRIDTIGRYTSLFFWWPRLARYKDFAPGLIKRVPLFVLVSNEQTIVVLGEIASPCLPCSSLCFFGTGGPCDGLVKLLRETMVDQQPVEMTPLQRPLVALLSVIASVYRTIAEQMQVAKVKVNPALMTEAEFLTLNFQLQHESARVLRNLRHNHKMLLGLQQLSGTLFQFSESASVTLKDLVDDIEEISDMAEEILEQLKSIVNMRVSLGSLKIDKVMRLLAVCSTLGLIPTIISSFLGMNLAPAQGLFVISLTQVAFIVASIMSMVVYLFYAQGWLTTH